MPTPNENETKEDYLSRCMGDGEMNAKHPKGDERYAVCHSMWEQHRKKEAAKNTAPKPGVL